ncbi:MAG TPA: transglutaminase domain-containing protein [Anaeromyxobacteraceae bacterium]|nr:transglutaminase domain-containing protein [Anaeromyxobacteraceae bacterium]
MNGAALVLVALAALPEGAVRYRMELAGERVGVAELSIHCGPAACAAAWETRLRAPEDGGGAVRARRISIEVDRGGFWRGGPIEVTEGGAARTPAGVRGAVPATLAEVVLLRDAAGGEACVEAFDEVSGERGRACARAVGSGLEADLLGGRARLVPGADGFPAEVALPDQGARFLRDPAAEVPAHPPRLHGTTVPGPVRPDGRLRFCGVAADPAPPPALEPGRLPPAEASGADCRERTRRWLDRAARRGLPGRTAVGVAWDGGAWVWHAWAEVELDGRWVAVDPSFHQAPARGPRFAVARYADGDEAARAAAGRRILGCWGRARVEVSSAGPGGGARPGAAGGFGGAARPLGAGDP